MEMQQEASCPNWPHLELDLHDSFDVKLPTTDDLSKLVASSNFDTTLQAKASASFGDVCLSPQLEAFAQQKGSFNVVEAGISSNNSKMSSWNISFGHPHSAHEQELNLFSCAHRKKCASIDTAAQREKMQMVENILASVEEGFLYSDLERTTSTLHARKRKRASRNTHGTDQYVVERILSCIDDEYICPSMESIEHMHLDDFIRRHGSGLADHLDASTLSKGESHVLAERKRREKLNERFIALSAILPGLKKMDKLSVLGDAIKYVKHLEEQLLRIEDTKVTKAAKFFAAKDCYTTNCDKSVEIGGIRRPDIEARAAGKNVLIHVHCDKMKNILVRFLEELERMPLSITNANVLSFSNTTLELTFTAQIEEDSDLTANAIVEALHTFFNQLH